MAQRRYGISLDDLIQRIWRPQPFLAQALQMIQDTINGLWNELQHLNVTVPDHSITARKLAQNAVTTNAVVAGAIDATKVNIRDVIVENMTLTNNSPSSGNVAWSSCTVYYAGTAYTIASGNTTSGHKLIYWTVGNTSFSEADTFAPAANVFLIATNTSGTADVAWNKLASRGIQESNLVNGLLVGNQIQGVVTATGITQLAGTTYYLDTTGDGTHTGGGLLTIGIRCNTARTTGINENTVQLIFEIDNQTPNVLDIYTNPSNQWNEVAKTISDYYTGDGAGIGDTVRFSFGIGFQTHLRVGINNVGSSVIGTGKVDLSILYCTKTT